MLARPAPARPPTPRTRQRRQPDPAATAASAAGPARRGRGRGRPGRARCRGRRSAPRDTAAPHPAPRAAPRDSRAKVAGRSTSRSRPSICSAPPRTSREATDRNGTSARPPGRAITSSTRNRSPAGSRQVRVPGRPQVGADERPRPQRHRRIPVPGSRSNSHGSPGPSPGSVSTSTRTWPSRSRARSQIPAASASGEHPPEQLRPGLRQLRLRLPRDRRRRVGGELRVILQVPADPLRLPAIRRGSELGHRHPPRRARPATITSTRRRPADPPGMSLIRSSATTSPPADPAMRRN